MALRESTTLDVLAGNTDVMSLGDQRAKGQGLSSGPVNVLALNNRLGTVGKDTLQVTVNVEVLGRSANDRSDVLQSLVVHAGRVVRQNFSSQFLGRLEAVPS